MKLLRWSALLLVITSMFAAKARSADWPPINPEDLSMKDIKEQPGAPALILLREETDDDMNNAHSVYERIKILTDAGREYANVELPYSRRGFSIGAVPLGHGGLPAGDGIGLRSHRWRKPFG